MALLTAAHCIHVNHVSQERDTHIIILETTTNSKSPIYDFDEKIPQPLSGILNLGVMTPFWVKRLFWWCKKSLKFEERKLSNEDEVGIMYIKAFIFSIFWLMQCFWFALVSVYTDESYIEYFHPGIYFSETSPAALFHHFSFHTRINFCFKFSPSGRLIFSSFVPGLGTANTRSPSNISNPPVFVR